MQKFSFLSLQGDWIYKNLVIFVVAMVSTSHLFGGPRHGIKWECSESLQQFPLL